MDAVVDDSAMCVSNVHWRSSVEQVKRINWFVIGLHYSDMSFSLTGKGCLDNGNVDH